MSAQLQRWCTLPLFLAALVLAWPAHAQIKIGFQAPLTGAAATDGVSAKIAAETARDKLNAAGGVLGQKIELVTYEIRRRPRRLSSPRTSSSARMA